MNTSAASVEPLLRPVVQWPKPMPQLTVQTAMWMPFACFLCLRVLMLVAQQRVPRLPLLAPQVVAAVAVLATEIQ